MNIIERIARALAKRNYPAFNDADIDEMWEGWSEDAATAIKAMRDPTPEMIEAGDDRSGEAWICEGIPDDVIEAGIEAWEIAKSEMEDREMSDTPELMTDWDDGMVVAAIYKAMVARQAMIDASPIDAYEMERGG